MRSNTNPNIRLDAAALRDDSVSFQREWLVTNGIGGYASASVSTANTRRYHGLLVAALRPPLGRAVLLSKLEDTLEITARSATRAQSFPLSSNLYSGAVYPQGHRSLESWRAYPAPAWVWCPIPGVRIEKSIWMAPGANATCIAYRLLDAPEGSAACLRLIPLLAWKDYHAEMHACAGAPSCEWSGADEIGAPDSGDPIRLRLSMPIVLGVTDRPIPLDLRLTNEKGRPVKDASFTADPAWYYRFQHPREQERGLDFEEDLYSPGSLCAPLAPGETLVVTASVAPAAIGADPDPRSPQALSMKILNLQTALARQSRDDTDRLLALAAKAFVVRVPGVRCTVIAGYPWFSDWGRDTMIALPGLCLPTGLLDEAREILLSFARHVDGGMLPNRFPDAGDAPEYNTVDATLWYFWAIHQYVEATGDTDVLREGLWTALERIVQAHRKGTRYNIHVDPADRLLYAGEEGAQLTWMDARVGGREITPRIGKPVEINALWINALFTMSEFARRLGDAKAVTRYADAASAADRSFRAKFPRPDGKGLFDVIDTPPGGLPDASVRPNQIFALSLPFAPLDPVGPLADSIRNVISEELLTDYGLRTLSPRDPRFCPRYEGDPGRRDSAYHQGTVWPWLLGAFAEAHFKAHGDRQAARDLLKPLAAHLADYGLGSLPEIADGADPQRPNGCIAQAWSVAETLRVWRLLAG
jgi:predicted glycogen debranching enzyme